MDASIDHVEPAAEPTPVDGPDDRLSPVHPDYTKVLRIVAALVALPALVAAMVLELATPVWPFAVSGPLFLVAAYFVIRFPLRRYQARGYTMETDRLRVVQGTLFRSDTVVPFGRVQHIDVDQGPIERHYGLAKLVLHTAGNHNSSVALPGLPEETARDMRDTIRARIKRNTA